MREIKFRAWDLVRNLMVETSTLDIQDWEYMQYTGLKDKNGKEIYEGDIVKMTEVNSSDELILEVKFSTYDDGEQYTEWEHLGWIARSANGRRKTLPDTNFRCEVIGNIYENKDLLVDK